MNSHQDLFLDINKFDINNIVYIKPLLFYKVTKNIGIYYKKDIESDKKQKIIIQSPKMIIPFGIKEFNNNGKKSYQLSLSFSTLTNLYNEDEIKKFFLFIQKIDKTNEETILAYRKKWGLPKNLSYRKTLQRLSKDYPHHMNLNLSYDDKYGFLFNVYDEKASKSDVKILEKRSIISVVIELTDLKFTNKDFRSNWTIMQIRKFKPYSPINDFFMSGCFICDQDDPEDKVYAQLVERYQKSLRTTIGSASQSTVVGTSNVSTLEEKDEKIVSIFRPPSLEELLNAKGSLKKTKTVTKGFLQNNDIPIPPPPPKDKKIKNKLLK